MKKLLALILSMVTVFSLFACGKKPEGKNLKTKDSKTEAPKPEDSKPEDSKPEVSKPEDSKPEDSDDDPAKRTDTAVVVGDRKISTAELTYFYIDGINNWYSQYGSYASYIGLNPSIGLEQQFYDEELEMTWADFFLEQAVESAKNVYALCDAAEKENFKLSAQEQANVATLYDNLNTMAENSKKSVTAFLQEIYGNGSDEQTYKKYYQDTVLASAYYSHHAEELKNSYTSTDLREFEKDAPYQYNSYTYASFYLPLDAFKLGGTKDEKGNITYSEEEVNDAKEYLERFKDQLSARDIDTVEKLNGAIAKMEDEWYAIKGEPAAAEHSTATENTKMLYSMVSSVVQEWLRDESRKNGDITAIAYKGDGDELKGYYIVLFQQCHDNYHPLANVRHILVAFEGGNYNNLTGMPTYSDAEKKKAKDEADKLLKEWKDGAATEDSFAALANKHSDDGDGTTGGLYEDVYPGQMVTNFNNWCFSEGRKASDSGIVETEYGYHVMFYSGDSTQSYRDYMVTNDKLTEEMNAWQEDLLDSVTVEEKNLDSIDKDLVLSSGN